MAKFRVVVTHFNNKKVKESFNTEIGMLTYVDVVSGKAVTDKVKIIEVNGKKVWINGYGKSK